MRAPSTLPTFTPASRTSEPTRSPSMWSNRACSRSRSPSCVRCWRPRSRGSRAATTSTTAPASSSAALRCAIAAQAPAGRVRRPGLVVAGRRRALAALVVVAGRAIAQRRAGHVGQMRLLPRARAAAPRSAPRWCSAARHAIPAAPRGFGRRRHRSPSARARAGARPPLLVIDIAGGVAADARPCSQVNSRVPMCHGAHIRAARARSMGAHAAWRDVLSTGFCGSTPPRPQNAASARPRRALPSPP